MANFLDSQKSIIWFTKIKVVLKIECLGLINRINFTKIKLDNEVNNEFTKGKTWVYWSANWKNFRKY